MTLYDWELRERRDEDTLAPTYHDSHHEYPIARYWDEDFSSFAHTCFQPGDRVLDLGCGPGSLWTYWRRFESPERLVGVDLSERMIHEARRRHPHGDFRVGRVHDLPFDAGSFDLVIASSVLHHVPPSYLGAAFQEISRVLDEHGRIVGREPSSAHSFGTTAGWTSSAIMSFRHLVFRLTRSREYYGGQLGEHHHVPDVKFFLETLGEFMRPTRVQSRFPFSSYVLRVRSQEIARLAQAIDAKLAHRAGVMFYYVAEKNYATAEDVAHCVEMARRDDPSAVSEDEFRALLQAASAEVERILTR